jgi:hypothetical protein
MRITLLSIAFLFLAFSAQSQVLKSAGVWYFLDVDSMTARPAVLPNGTELAYVVGTKTVYYWNRNTSTWTAYGSTFNRDSIYFDSSIVGSGTVSDPWRVDSTLFATIAGVGDSIAAALSGYPSGSGTTNYYAKWSSSTALGIGNLFDNNTYAGVISRPWKFGEYTTAGLPTGVTGYTLYNTTLNGIGWYDGTRWNYVPKAVKSAFTSTYIPYTNSSGQYDESSLLAWDPSTVLAGGMGTGQMRVGGSNDGSYGRLFVNGRVSFRREFVMDRTAGGFAAYFTFVQRNAGEATALSAATGLTGASELFSFGAPVIIGTFSGSSSGRLSIITAQTNRIYINESGLVSVGVSGGGVVTATRFGVLGSGTTSSTYTARFDNSTGSNFGLAIRDDGLVSIGAAPTTSAQFAVTSTTGGILPPRWTSAQRTAISSPTTGLFGYQTDGTEGVYFKDASAWKRLLWDGDNLSNLSTTITSGHVLYSTGSAVAGSANHFWDNTNGRLGLGTISPTEQLHVADDLRVGDSTRLATTPAHTSITGLLTRDANGWVGLASLSGLSYSGGVLTGLNIGNTDLTIPSGTDRTLTFGGGTNSSGLTFYNDPSYLGSEFTVRNNTNSDTHAYIQDFHEIYDKTAGKYSIVRSKASSLNNEIQQQYYAEKGVGQNYLYGYITSIRNSGLQHGTVGTVMDSVGKSIAVGTFASLDSLTSSNASKVGLFSGFGYGRHTTYNRRHSLENKSWTVQQTFGASGVLGYNWIQVKDINLGDTTLNSVWLYEKYNFPNTTPSTTAGRTQFINWTAGLPSFTDRYKTDTLWDEETYIKMDTTNSFQYLKIGDIRDGGSFEGNPDEYGLLIKKGVVVIAKGRSSVIATEGRVDFRGSISGIDGLEVVVDTNKFSIQSQSTGDTLFVVNKTETKITGLLNANREAYHTVTSTTSPDTLSQVYADNLINQGGTQATFTLALPSSPLDGQIAKLTFVNAITTLTIDGNGTSTVGALPTTAAVGTQIVFKNYTGIGWVRQL